MQHLTRHNNVIYLPFDNKENTPVNTPLKRRRRGPFIVLAGIVLLVVGGLIISSCAAMSASIEDLNRELNGVSATVQTFDQAGHPIDRVHGLSIQVHRNGDFDSSGRNSDGTSFNVPDSEVLQISVGENTMYHVGSTMIIAEDGLEPVSGAPTQLDLENADRGRPWLNSFFEKNRNLWGGRAKTIVIRSQDGLPIAVYAGDQVEIYATDIPKSTRLRVDGKFLLIYRADYTIPDTALLGA